jgi:hypothetical protein
MTIGRPNNEKMESFGSWKAPPNVGLQKYIRVLFIDKNNVLPGQWVHSITPQCTRSQAYVCSITRSALKHSQLLKIPMAQQ